MFSCNASYKLSKTEWTVDEVKTWSSQNKDYSTWKGLLLYQGTDSTYHHFISRINDEWTWFNIEKSTLQLNEEKPFDNTSKGKLGYYYVDPNNNFIKVKDYLQQNNN